MRKQGTYFLWEGKALSWGDVCVCVHDCIVRVSMCIYALSYAGAWRFVDSADTVKMSLGILESPAG